MAAWEVEHLFPPSSIDTTYRILVSLNLLNAIVKQPVGRELTSYNYIKGMAACMFLWLLYHPMDDVSIWWDSGGSLTYFQLRGRQFSFHFVPLLSHYSGKMQQVGLQSLKWDGLRMQEIGMELFEQAVPELPQLDDVTSLALQQRMKEFGVWQLRTRVRGMSGVDDVPGLLPPQAPPQEKACHSSRKKPKQQKEMTTQHVPQMPRHRFVTRTSRCVLPYRHYTVNAFCERRLCLEVALKFNIWRASGFELHRRDDIWCVKALRYTGKNYQQLVDTIVGNHPRANVRPKSMLEKGSLYYLCRTDRIWHRVSPSRHMLLLAHYNYLRIGFQNFNLCVTHAVALYLAQLFPALRFVNVLNYTRMTCHRYTYGYLQLLNIPPNSQSRWKKVWLVNDPCGLLSDFDVDSIPKPILNEYLMADDYYQYFQVVTRNGCEGLVAYSRFHLLRPVWAKVKLQGHYAYVMAHNRKWAIYSLMEECFVSGFVYNSIWFDKEREVIVGRIENEIVDIHELYC